MSSRHDGRPKDPFITADGLGSGRAVLERKPIDVLTQNNYSGSVFARVSGRKGAATSPRI